VSSIFVTRPIDTVIVQGRSKPIEIFEALGEKGGSIPSQKLDFVKGLSLYRQLRFSEARKVFEKGKIGDPTSQIFYDRCGYFLKNPPPENWNGVWIPKHK